jgi:hypothetical protein
MNDPCPNCGFCPTCKRARAVAPGFYPYQGPYVQQGYLCTCGLWVAYGSPHACNVWARPIWYSSTTGSTTTAANVLSGTGATYSEP